MRSRAEVLDAANKIVNDFKDFSKDTVEWELCKSSPKKEIIIYRTPSKYTKGHMFKGETSVYGSPERVFDILHPTSCYKLQWDPHVRRCIVLEELAYNTFLMQVQLKPALMGLISVRDSVEVCIFEEDDDEKRIILGSVDHGDYPPNKEFIRGWNYPSGAIIKKSREPNRTDVTVIFQGELNSSMIPLGLFEKAMPILLMQFMQGVLKTEMISYVPLMDVPGRRRADWVPALSSGAGSQSSRDDEPNGDGACGTSARSATAFPP